MSLIDFDFHDKGYEYHKVAIIAAGAIVCLELIKCK